MHYQCNNVHASEVYEFILFKSYYDELGRTNYYARRIHIITRYWFKVINSEEHKYMKKLYNVMLTEFKNRPNIRNWASLVRNTLCNLVFLMFGLHRE